VNSEILVIDDQAEIHSLLMPILTRQGYSVVGALSASEGMNLFHEKQDTLTLVILDLDLGPGEVSGLELLKEMKAANSDIPVMILTGVGTTATAVKAIKMGASDFLEKGFYLPEQLEAHVAKAEALLKIIEENRALRKEKDNLAGQADFFRKSQRRKYRIVGKSRALTSVLDAARQVAEIPRPVLIRGERGCGKELLAGYIHFSGNRADKPFITINSAAFHGDLLASEMFGHEKGAFTGADKRKIGRFELADTGTLFFDEIGNMDLAFQEKILRVIEYQSFERVQGVETVHVDVRVIAATNANLEELMRAGAFRRDLYDRLSFVTITMPPLRERLEDVPLLARYFIEEMTREVPGLRAREFTPEAMAKLCACSWPGNVRELKNCVERLLCTGRSGPVLGEEIEQYHPDAAGGDVEATSFKEKLRACATDLIRKALESTGGNQKEAAKVLELTYDQFRHQHRKLLKRGADVSAGLPSA